MNKSTIATIATIAVIAFAAALIAIAALTGANSYGGYAICQESGNCAAELQTRPSSELKAKKDGKANAPTAPASR